MMILKFCLLIAGFCAVLAVTGMFIVFAIRCDNKKKIEIVETAWEEKAKGLTPEERGRYKNDFYREFRRDHGWVRYANLKNLKTRYFEVYITIRIRGVTTSTMMCLEAFNRYGLMPMKVWMRGTEDEIKRAFRLNDELMSTFVTCRSCTDLPPVELSVDYDAEEYLDLVAGWLREPVRKTHEGKICAFVCNLDDFGRPQQFRKREKDNDSQ